MKQLVSTSTRTRRLMATLRQIKPPPPPTPREWTRLENVRKRPGMYVGDVNDGTGLSRCLWEVVSNAIDQHLAGRLRTISVSIDDSDTAEVVDDGLGIPVVRDEHGLPLLERICCELHLRPTLDDHLPHVHFTEPGFGCGLASTAAVSALFEIETVSDGRAANLVMERGVKVGDVVEMDTDRPSGTRVRFRPDPEIFRARFDEDAIRARLEELAWWAPHLRVLWQGAVLPGLGGADTWLRSMGVTGPVLATRVPAHSVGVDLALGYLDSDRCDIRTFVNLHPTLEGTHKRGVFDALVAVARMEGVRGTRRKLEARVSRGLVARVHVWVTAPQFGPPTRDQLRTPEARPAVGEAMVNAIVHRGTEGAFLRDVKNRARAGV